MDTLVIQVSWEYALGIVALLIAGPAIIAWYANGRFTALETSMQWVKDTLHDLKVSAENATAPTPAFGAGSPIDLKPTGVAWLAESGLKDFIDAHKDGLMAQCNEKKGTNPYEVQKHVFAMFDTLALPAEVDDALKKFAFEKGTSMGIMRRVGAIYLRNLCLNQFGMKKEDIDAHEAAENGGAA